MSCGNPCQLQVNYRSHHGGVEIDPDARDADTNQKGIEETKKFISRYLTGVSTTISIVEPCIVTVSNFYIQICKYIRVLLPYSIVILHCRDQAFLPKNITQKPASLFLIYSLTVWQYWLGIAKSIIL